MNYLFDMSKEIDGDNVRWRSKKKYRCKKSKGEHEYLTPTIKYKQLVRYIYDTGTGILDAGEPQKDYKYLRTEVSIVLETVCKHCGHKCLTFFRDKIT